MSYQESSEFYEKAINVQVKIDKKYISTTTFTY